MSNRKVSEANLSMLFSRHPSLRSDLSTDSATDLQPVVARSGVPSARYRGKYIHSPYDPVQEAERLIREECPSEVSSCVIFGFGLGYHVEAFIRQFPEVPLLVVEPDRSLFIGALGLRDLKAIFARPTFHLHLSSTPESVSYILDELAFEQPTLIRLRSIYSINEDFFRCLDAIIQSLITRRQINLNTLKRFGRLWVRNLVKNLDLLAEAPGVARLEGFFKGFPALVLASGPSLDTVRPYLAELAECFLIIAVDTSLRACSEAGVDADFVVSVDPQYWNTRHMDWIHPRRTYLISESSAHPRLFRLLDLPKFFGSSLFPLGRHFERLVGEKGKLGAGGSVSTSAWDFARLSGAHPIYMAGLDLGFPDGKTHFKGAFFEDGFHSLSRRFHTVESMASSYLFEAYPYPVTPNTGDLVLTDRRMAVYKWWFENQMKIFKDTATYNLSSQGVKIEGMPWIGVESLAAFPPVRAALNDRLEQVRALSQEHTGRREVLFSAIQRLSEDLSRIETLSDRALRETDRLIRLFKAGRSLSSSLSSLDSLDRELLQTGSRDIVSFLLQPLIKGILAKAQERNKSKPNEIFKASTELYDQLRESARFHLSLLPAHGA